MGRPPEAHHAIEEPRRRRRYLDHGFYHLFVLPVEGGTPRQVTSGSFHHRDAPVWTPDSQSLVFSANRNEDWEYEFRNSEIYKVSVADGTVETLTNRNGPDRSPTFRPTDATSPISATTITSVPTK